MKESTMDRVELVIGKTIELQDMLLETELPSEVMEAINVVEYTEFLNNKINEMKWRLREMKEFSKSSAED